MEKRVLLALSGLNPQIITETLYALHQRGRMVDEIHLITTAPGLTLLQDGLLGEEGALAHLCRDHTIRPPLLTDAHIHLPHNQDGTPLHDIITEEDNEHLLRLTTDLARQLTTPQNRVYFLVAGGRKTMSSCLTLAAQLYGRRRDRLFHILVSPQFEASPHFWYPPTTTHPSTEGLHLITIPFVSLRQHLPPELLNTPNLPGTLLTATGQPTLILDLKNATVTYADVELDMHPARLALYAFFCQAACRNRRYTAVQVLDSQQEISELYHTISEETRRLSDSGITALSVENFNSYKSKIKQDLSRAFGDRAEALFISSRGKRPDTTYGIELSGEQIRFE